MWIITAWEHLTRSDCERFKKCCISNAMDEMVICFGKAVKRMGILGVSVWKMKALTVKMESDASWYR